MNTATSEECAASSEELSGQAGILKGLVQTFKLDGLAFVSEKPVSDNYISFEEPVKEAAPVYEKPEEKKSFSAAKDKAEEKPAEKKAFSAVKDKTEEKKTFATMEKPAKKTTFTAPVKEQPANNNTKTVNPYSAAANNVDDDDEVEFVPVDFQFPDKIDLDLDFDDDKY